MTSKKKKTNSDPLDEVSMFFAEDLSRAQFAYRISDDIYKKCASTSKNLHCNFKFDEPIILTRLRELLKNEDSEYISEAIYLTYPTKVLTKKVAKALSREFDLEDVVFSTALSERNSALKTTNVHEILANLMKYQKSIDRMVDFDPTKDTLAKSYVGFMKNTATDVEKDVAGTIYYELKMQAKDLTGDHSSTAQRSTTLSRSFIQQLVEIGHTCGYGYVGYSAELTSDKRFILIDIKYESLRQNSDIELADDLYHVAPKAKTDKIMKSGLVPKKRKLSSQANTANVEQRTYVFNGRHDDVIQQFITQRVQARWNSISLSSGISKDDTEFSLFKIDRTKIPDTVFYRDNMFASEDRKHPYAVYTYDMIPPKALTLVGTLHV